MKKLGQRFLVARATLLATIVVAVGVLSAAPGLAQDPYHCIEDLSEDELDHRIRGIERNFEEGQQHAAAWRFGWMFSSAGILTWPAYNLSTRDAPKAERYYEWAIIAGGVATVLQLAVVPMPGVWGAKRIRRKPQNTIEEKRKKLLYATKKLEQSSNIQAWFGGLNYGGSGVVYGIVMGSVYLGLYHDDIGSLESSHDRAIARLRAAGLFLIPPTLTISQAMTAPQHSYLYWEDYREIACSGRYLNTGDDGPEFDLSIGPTNVSFKVRF